MFEKWTKTSLPPSREMNPKPFSELKNFTVPVAMVASYLFLAWSSTAEVRTVSRWHPHSVGPMAICFAIRRRTRRGNRCVRPGDSRDRQTRTRRCPRSRHCVGPREAEEHVGTGGADRDPAHLEAAIVQETAEADERRLAHATAR